jgi:ABC-type transport system involved in cytochrome c biogenesis permease subunit
MTAESRSRVSPRLHDSIAVGALLIAFVFALFSPEDVVQGDLTRMLYIHVPSIITAYAAFALTTVATIGYLGLRRSIVDPDSRARRSAILGVVAVVQIPIVHYSVLWWNTLHQAPTILRPGDPQIDGPLLAALLVGMAAFLVVFSALLRRRLALAGIESRLHSAGLSVDAPLAGDAVTAPQLGAAAVEDGVR